MTSSGHDIHDEHTAHGPGCGHASARHESTLTTSMMGTRMPPMKATTREGRPRAHETTPTCTVTAAGMRPSLTAITWITPTGVTAMLSMRATMTSTNPGNGTRQYGR